MQLTFGAVQHGSLTIQYTHLPCQMLSSWVDRPIPNSAHPAPGRDRNEVKISVACAHSWLCEIRIACTVPPGNWGSDARLRGVCQVAEIQNTTGSGLNESTSSSAVPPEAKLVDPCLLVDTSFRESRAVHRRNLYIHKCGHCRTQTSSRQRQSHEKPTNTRLMIGDESVQMHVVISLQRQIMQRQL